MARYRTTQYDPAQCTGSCAALTGTCDPTPACPYSPAVSAVPRVHLSGHWPPRPSMPGAAAAPGLFLLMDSGSSAPPVSDTTPAKARAAVRYLSRFLGHGAGMGTVAAPPGRFSPCPSPQPHWGCLTLFRHHPTSPGHCASWCFSGFCSSGSSR